jgi:hypothetical protein
VVPEAFRHAMKVEKIFDAAATPRRSWRDSASIGHDMAGDLVARVIESGSSP